MKIFAELIDDESGRAIEKLKQLSKVYDVTIEGYYVVRCEGISADRTYILLSYVV